MAERSSFHNAGKVMDSINNRIAEELGVRPQQVAAAVALLDEGSSVPFISRYRKEVTGSLDDTQLRNLEERLRYLRELDERRVSILASINEQGIWNSVRQTYTPYVDLAWGNFTSSRKTWTETVLDPGHFARLWQKFMNLFHRRK